MIIELTDKNFSETVASGKVIIDFWADWCGPCRVIAPIVEEIARELPIYRRLPRPETIFWVYELMMVLNHLRFLEEQGYAGHDGDTWYPAKNLGTAKLSL